VVLGVRRSEREPDEQQGSGQQAEEEEANPEQKRQKTD
jgi:hypothetical protein